MARVTGQQTTVEGNIPHPVSLVLEEFKDETAMELNDYDIETGMLSFFPLLLLKHQTVGILPKIRVF